MKKSFILIVTLIIVIGLFYTRLSLTLVSIGMIAAFIGTLAGGGGLITIPAMMLVGIPIHTGIATNKFSTGIAALSSIFYLLYQQELRLASILKYVTIAFTGGGCGALLTIAMSEQLMNMIACLLLILVLFLTLKRIDLAAQSDENETKQDYLLWQPFLIAVYDGGFGPGSSTFSILHYLRQHYSYIKAVQLTRVLLFGSCTGAFLVFYQSGFIQWKYAIAMAVGSIIGSQLGLLVLPKIPIKAAKILLTLIISLLLIQVIVKILTT